jgi:hypothetical protein
MIPGQPMMAGEGGDDMAPAAQLLPIMAMLAQQQQGAMNAQQQQEDMMKEQMRQQIIRLISMMPTKNPAGVAARTEPLPPSMSPSDMSSGENENSTGDMSEDANEEMMS